MKEKIINYIETLEAKAYQSDDYFKQRNDFRVNSFTNDVRDDLLRILDKVDKEK